MERDFESSKHSFLLLLSFIYFYFLFSFIPSMANQTIVQTQFFFSGLPLKCNSNRKSHMLNSIKGIPAFLSQTGSNKKKKNSLVRNTDAVFHQGHRLSRVTAFHTRLQQPAQRLTLPKDTIIVTH